MQLVKCVYVIGASKEIERADRAIEALRAVGLDVVEDWPVNFRREVARIAAGVSEAEETKILRAAATADAFAALSAPFVWFLVPRASTAGAWFELGVAAGRLLLDRVRSPSLVVSLEEDDDRTPLEILRQNIFTPSEKLVRDADGARLLAQTARRLGILGPESE